MVEKLEIKLRRADGNQDLPLPAYMSSGAAGMDLYAAVTDPVVIPPSQVAMIPLGFSISLPGFNFYENI